MSLLNHSIEQSQFFVLVLVGPTASGKTALALELAEHLQIGVINIDSRQFYIGMDIGTAKPTKEEQKRVPHALLDISHPNNPINLKEFQRKADKKIEQAVNKYGLAFLVGGSGLYLKSLTHGLIPPAVAPQPKFREQLGHLGQPICHQILQIADPKAAKKISTNDAIRTQRALEVIYATGKPISGQQSKKPPPWKVLEIGLDPKNLKERIAERTELMYSKGLIKETNELILHYGVDLPMLNTIGYQEALKVIQGEINQAKAIEITTRRTQQLAKRQRTWFKKQHDPHWLKSEEPLSEALSLIRSGLM